MNPAPVDVPAGAPSCAPSSAEPSDIEARIAYLFRAARREGRIHPLQHLIQRYRAEAASTGGPA